MCCSLLEQFTSLIGFQDNHMFMLKYNGLKVSRDVRCLLSVIVQWGVRWCREARQPQMQQFVKDPFPLARLSNNVCHGCEACEYCCEVRIVRKYLRFEEVLISAHCRDLCEVRRLAPRSTVIE